MQLKVVKNKFYSSICIYHFKNCFFFLSGESAGGFLQDPVPFAKFITPAPVRRCLLIFLGQMTKPDAFF